MSGGWLNFSVPSPGTLNFGQTVSFDYELSVELALSQPSCNWQFYGGIPYSCYSGAAWQSASPVRNARTARMCTAIPSARSVGSVWETAAPARLTRTIPTLNALRKEVGKTVLWGAPYEWESVATLPWENGLRESLWMALPWENGLREGLGMALPWGNGLLEPRAFAIQWSAGAVSHPGVAVPWQQGKPPLHGWRILVTYPGTERHDGALNFICLRPGALDFGNRCFGGSPLYPAFSRSYRVINTASLIRVADSVDIPCSALSVSLDRDSWCWSLSATVLGRAAHDLVPAYPGRVRATINGFAWDFVVDDVRYSRAFGQFQASLSGRGPAACYAAPYAIASSRTQSAAPITAQQLIMQEMGEGWTLDWSSAISDWTISGYGTWQYDGLTPIEAMTRIAKTTGAWLYADAQTQILHVVPRWPVKPWDWSAFVPDVSLPSSYTRSESRQLSGGTAYEGITITGGVNGIAALITRTGTGGTTWAPTQVAKIITDLAPAKALAIAELADRWPLKHYTIDLPLQAIPGGAGLLLPGTTLDFVDGGYDGWRGLITGVSISAGRAVCTQTLEAVAPV